MEPAAIAVRPEPRSRRGKDKMSYVNMAARQRMLSQRMALQLLRAHLGDARQLSDAKASFEIFTQSQATLESIVASLNTSGANTHLVGVYLGDRGVSTVIREFIARTSSAIGSIESRSPAAESVLKELLERNDDYLAALNQATEAFDLVAANRASRQRSEVNTIVNDILRVARESRVVSFNAKVISARAGTHGREFAVVAQVLITISDQIDSLASNAMELLNAMGSEEV